jgi:2-dehydropantoate 2-reductase
VRATSNEPLRGELELGIGSRTGLPLLSLTLPDSPPQGLPRPTRPVRPPLSVILEGPAVVKGPWASTGAVRRRTLPGMRFVVYGAGAVGGVVGARLYQSGHEVTLIARGAHLEAIRRGGLTLLAPEERSVLRIAAVGDPGEVRWCGDEVVLLAVKSQDTDGALGALRDAATHGVSVVCLQNGVENERRALRLFERVYGATVMTPTAHLEPGVVAAYGTEVSATIDLGRYPAEVDGLAEQIVAALCESRILARAVPDTMRLKYAKLLLNLADAVDALCGAADTAAELIQRARVEGEAALTAAGIAFLEEDVSDLWGRWERMGVGEIAGRPRAGSSTWQSLQRGARSLETDHLNGEIVLVGRLHGVPTPVNAALCVAAARAVRDRATPGSVPVADVLAMASAA